MRALLSREAVRELDVDAIERLGVPGIVLMENAGRGASEALLERFGRPCGSVLLVGGPGQNGGDAWVVARHLHNQGIAVRCALVGDRAKVSGDALTNLRALEAIGVTIRPIAAGDTFDALAEGAALMVDGLFGTGLDRPVRGLFAEVIGRMAAAPVPVMALDLPSGVDANTGAVLGCAAPAALTVTFAALKRGLYQYPARGVCGEIRCVSIGVPEPAASSLVLIEPDASGLLARRPGDSHKGRAGHVLVVAGAQGTSGAALLCARGAFRGGGGLVTIAPRGEARASIELRVLEEMTLEVPTSSAEDAARALCAAAQGKASAVVGPGLGSDAFGLGLARLVASELPVPAVLDADALTAHAGDLAALRDCAAPRVLTPHPGEAARLLGMSVAEVQADRYAAARELAARSGQVVVLKGAGSVVAHPDGRGGVCDRGTPALGVAGAGDVLAGVLGACLPHEAPFEAACIAVWLHARAAELATRADRGIVASEVADCVPHAIREIQARFASVSSA